MAQTEMKTNKTKRDKESGQKYYNYERIKNEKRNRQKAKTLKFKQPIHFIVNIYCINFVILYACVLHDNFAIYIDIYWEWWTEMGRV